MLKREKNETEFLMVLQCGSQTTFSSVYSDFLPRLSYFANKFLADPMESETVAIDTLMALWSGRQDFEAIEQVRAFLYRTARNKCLNVIRSRKAERVKIEEYVFTREDSVEADAEYNRIRAEVVAHLYEQIEKLPTKCRQVFELYQFGDLKVEQIAQKLGISESTVRNQNARALKLLKKRLSASEWRLFLLFSIINTLSITCEMFPRQSATPCNKIVDYYQGL